MIINRFFLLKQVFLKLSQRRRVHFKKRQREKTEGEFTFAFILQLEHARYINPFNLVLI